MSQIPSVGRMVHYTSYGTPNREYKSQCRAAVVTEVIYSGPGTVVVNLAVLNPEGMFFNWGVPMERECELRAGTWHWPEKVGGE